MVLGGLFGYLFQIEIINYLPESDVSIAISSISMVVVFGALFSPVSYFITKLISKNKSKISNVKLLLERFVMHKNNQYFSRIHIDDIGNILFVSLTKFRSGEIYNLSDDKPTSSQEIIKYGARLLNIENIETIEVKDLESKMLKDFYKDSKKINNKKMKFFFDYKLKFPTYVEGLNNINDNFI